MLKTLLAQRDALLAAIESGERAMDDDTRTEMNTLVTSIETARTDEATLANLRAQGPAEERATVVVPVAPAAPVTPAAPAAREDDSTVDSRANVEQFIARGSNMDDAFVVRAALTTSNLFSDGVAHPSKTDLGVKVVPEGSNAFLALLPSRSIDTDVIEYVREVLTTNVAKEVAEGNLKPEATFELEQVTHGLATIANWITVTRQTLRSRSSLLAAIEGRLTANVRKRANKQVWSGDGVGANIEGLLNSGIQTFTGTFGTDGAGIHRTIRHAVTLAVVADAPAPTHYVINPLDAEEYDSYLESTTRAVGTGLVRVVDNAQPQGSVVVGALTDPNVAEILYRDGMEVTASREHSDNLTKNLVTILGEQEAGLAVYLPSAIVEGTFGAAA